MAFAMPSFFLLTGLGTYFLYGTFKGGIKSVISAPSTGQNMGEEKEALRFWDLRKLKGIFMGFLGFLC